MRPPAIHSAPADEGGGVAPIWAITFADMMTLLMSFFVLLFSFSSMEQDKFKEIAGSMREAFGVARGAVERPPAPGLPSGNAFGMVAALRDAIEQAGLGDRGSAVATSRGIALRLEGEAAFDSGNAELRPEVLPLLDRIADIATRTPGEIEIEGHTDDVPISNARYPSNWELSASRAGSAVRYLVSRGVPAIRLKAIGFADSRPLAANDTDRDRARNRRVEFVFVTAAAGPLEPAPATGR